MLRTLFFTVAAPSIGYVLYLYFYWQQMHAIVEFEAGVLDVPHIFLILVIVGFLLSLF